MINLGIVSEENGYSDIQKIKFPTGPTKKIRRTLEDLDQMKDV